MPDSASTLNGRSGCAAWAPSTASSITSDDVDRHRLDRRADVAAGQREQVLDQARHAGALGLDPIERLGVGGVRLGRVTLVVEGPLHAGEFGVTADRGQRRAQLVRGVGHELPHPLLALDASRELGADRAQQRVHRFGQLPDLGARLGDRHPPIEPGAFG